MTIRDKKKFAETAPAGFDGIFDWDFLKPAWPKANMAPMDIDGVIERRGKFLMFETKSPGVSIPRGQVITLEALVKTGYVTVFVLWGKTVEEIKNFDIWYLKDGQVVKQPYVGGSDEVVSRAAHWFRMQDDG